MTHPVRSLHIDGLSRRVGERRVVDGIDLMIGDGEVVTLVGPSGCGKSTLLRTIAGLERSDAGRVVVDGRDITDLPPEQRNIGVVFQEGSLFGHRRVAQNIAFGLRHLPRGERAARVDEMLDLVQLGGMGRRYPHQLSGGEQQRVALARALAPRPRVVLLDEPFASLDEVLRQDLRQQVAEILRSTGTTAILVTHDRHEALTIGDRVAVMREGRLHQCATPAAVYDTPSDRFVAGFIGVASFLPDATSTEGGSVLVARPHHLAVTPGGSDRVVRTEFAGATVHYTVQRSDDTTVIAAGPVDPALGVGSACTAHVIATSLHRVDATL